MKWHYAVSAVNTIIENALKSGAGSISIGFHGGGEPLLPWTFIKRITGYAETESRKNNLKLAVYSATNGLLSEKQLEWITEHFCDLNISFDGLPHIQDHHRPLPDGKGSFKFIDRTFKYLDKKKFNYGIRSTFTEHNIDLMEDSYDFIINNYNPRTIHFEPVFQCGRCRTDKKFEVNLEKFAKYFQKIDEKNSNRKVRFTYSGCGLKHLLTHSAV
jgi:sulfatase maturation enzyme AslB (radical SAM superfamily)